MNDPRFDTAIWTQFEVAGARADGRIENAGPGGVFIQSPEIPERGEKVWLDFEGPGGERIEALGIVWWTTVDCWRACGTREGFGVRLVASNVAYRRLLAQLAQAS